ncbi:hypothetical protein DPSP01_000767 [Paraphaeosphaeria sporulosa]
MSVPEVEAASSAPATENHSTARASASGKERNAKKFLSNAKKWFQKNDSESEELEPGFMGDCWACGARLEYTDIGATGIECLDCRMPN